MRNEARRRMALVFGERLGVKKPYRKRSIVKVSRSRSRQGTARYVLCGAMPMVTVEPRLRVKFLRYQASYPPFFDPASPRVALGSTPGYGAPSLLRSFP